VPNLPPPYHNAHLCVPSFLLTHSAKQIGEQLQKFLRGILRETTENKERRLKRKLDKRVLETDPSVTTNQPPQFPERTVLNVRDFKFLTQVVPPRKRGYFLSTALEPAATPGLASGSAAEPAAAAAAAHTLQAHNAESQGQQWRWNYDNPISAEVETIMRFFPEEKVLSERARRKREVDRQRSAQRTVERQQAAAAAATPTAARR